MRQSFLGQYLLGKGIISRDQLAKVSELQSKHNLKIGELAKSKGMLQESDIEAIRTQQMKKDRLFGELAVEMNLMTTEQVESLLSIQQEQHKNLEEFLLQENIVAQDILSVELESYTQFRKEQENRFDLEWVRSNLKDGDIIEVLISQTSKLISRLGDIEVQEGECRFDREYLEDLDIIIIDDIFGDRSLRYLLNITKNIISDVANGMLGAQGIYLSEGLCLDAGCEFVNIVCGNAIGKLADRGLSLEITTPQVKKFKRRYNYRFSKKEDSLVMPILVPQGAIEVAITADLYVQ